MDHNSYWVDDHFSTREVFKRLDQLKTRAGDVQTESGADLRSILLMIDQLETDIGRALLKLHAVCDMLLQKGLLTAEDLMEKAVELDASDGQEDGVLHPSLFRTPEEHNTTLSPRMFLIELEKSPSVKSPKEFLSELETGEDG